MFVITYPYTSKNYSIFYNKATIIYDTETQVYHKFDTDTQTYVKPKSSECTSNFNSHSNRTIDLSIFVSRPYYNSLNYPLCFQTLEEATLAKLHLLAQLSTKITNDIDHLQTKYAEACPTSLITSYTNLKLQYPEVFI